MKLKRGQIYIADLNPTVGCEQGGVRPVLIIQNNKGNKHSSTTIVAVITSKYDMKHRLPTHCYMPISSGLKEKSIVMLEQIKVIDKERLMKYIGKVSPKYMEVIDNKLMISFDIKFKNMNDI